MLHVLQQAVYCALASISCLLLNAAQCCRHAEPVFAQQQACCRQYFTADSAHHAASMLLQQLPDQAWSMLYKVSQQPQAHPLHCRFLLLFGSALVQIFADWQELEVHIKHLGHMFQIRMVADDNWDVTLQLIVMLANEQVKQAMVHLADEDSHPLALWLIRNLLPSQQIDAGSSTLSRLRCSLKGCVLKSQIVQSAKHNICCGIRMLLGLQSCWYHR
jgi:hypothetical protein